MDAGRAFIAEDEKKHSPVAVLSYGYWTRRFHRNPEIVGQTIYMNGVPLTVVGVTGQGFYGVESGGDAADVWIPLQKRAELNAWGVPATAHTLYGNPNWWCAMLMARLRPGVSQKQALVRMDAVFTHAAWETQGKEKHDGQPLTLAMVPARGFGLSASYFEQPMKVLMGMVALVLAIVCVNLLMLLGARNAVRQREFSVRLALGASRRALLRQLLTESTVLVGVGAGLGWLFAHAATKLLARSAEMDVSLAPDASVLMYTLAISVAAALLFGLWPLRAVGNAAISLGLRASVHQSTESRGHVLVGKMMIAAQMAICAALLFGAGLLVRTLSKYQHVDLGMKAAQVLAFGAHPTGEHDQAQLVEFYRVLIDRVCALPGVLSATVAEMRPGSGWVDANSFMLDGRRLPSDNGRNLLYTNSVGPGFFQTLGIPVLAGRGITAGDNQTAPVVAVVNETFADRFLNGASPIGHRIGQNTTIVGVVRDNKYQGADEEARPMAWFSYEQSPTVYRMDVEVRAEGNPMSLVPEIRRIVRQMDPNAPLGNPMVLKAQFAESYLMPTLFARLGEFFGGLAALLVAVGLYGTLAYRVSRRTSEIGIRMALGAARRNVMWMIVRESLLLVLVGLALGLPLAWFGSRLMASMLYQVSTHDPASFGFAVSGVVAVSIAAALAPARRAAGVDPMQALRHE